MSRHPSRQPNVESISRVNQQASGDSGQAFPQGIVQRIELPYQKHADYLEGNKADLTLMLKLDHVRLLMERYDEPWVPFEPTHSVITSSAMDDDQLLEWDWKREAQVVQEFCPDFHLVGDRSIYQTMSVPEQEEALQKWAKATVYISRAVDASDVTLIPFAKGWENWHFSYCANVLSHLGYENCAFYASEYENRKNKLKTHVRRLVSQIQPEQVLVIGPQSQSHLEELPPEVVGAAGTRWRRKNTVAGRISVDGVEEWKPPREELLGTGQSTLDSFDSSTHPEANS